MNTRNILRPSVQLVATVRDELRERRQERAARRTLERELANRYVASALCSWHATGGEIPGLLPRLSDQELNVTQSVNNTGNVRLSLSVTAHVSSH